MQTISPEKIERFNTLIDKAGTVAIVSHTHPDGDALGCCIALKQYLEVQRGKNVFLFLEDNYSRVLSFLLTPYEEDFINQCARDPRSIKKTLHAADLSICLDCNSFDRTGVFQKAFEGLQTPKVLIDHHLNPKENDFELCFSEVEISSASELLLNVLKAMPDVGGDIGKLSQRCLRALLTGITTDTNNFDNSVFPSTLLAVSELLAAGVDRDGILSHIYNEYPEGRIRLMGYLLDKSLTITPEGVAYMILRKSAIKKFGLRDGDTEGIVNIPLAIKNVKMSIFLREDIRHFRVSLRSKNGCSANDMAAKYFHGGGHEKAAGGKLFFPKDILFKRKAASYVERCSKEFFAPKSER